MSKKRLVLMVGFIIMAVLILILVFSFVFKQNKGPNPTFFKIRGFPELVTIPTDSVYGSTIDLWVYQTEEGSIDRVIVTGHADNLTCSRASAALITSWMGMSKDPESHIGAGFGYLEAKRDPNVLQRIEQLKENETVQEYIESLRNMREPNAELLQDKSVQEFRSLSNQDELTELVKTFRALGQESGLVTVHTLDASGYRKFEAAVAEHVQSLTISDSPTIIDIVQTDSEQLPVLVPFYHLDGSGILKIELDKGIFRTKKFPELASAHSRLVREELEREARRRLSIYKDWLEDDKSKLDHYSNLLSKGIDEPVHIWWERQYNPPTVRSLLAPETMPASDYLPEVLQPLIRDDRLWIDKMEEVLALIKELDDSPERLNTLNFSILVDSLLRNWELAFTHPLLKEAYRSWVKEARGKVWREIQRQLEDQGVVPEVVIGENVIFTSHLEGDTVVIVPHQILDSRNCSLVLDNRNGIVNYLNAWEMRELDPLYEDTGPNPPDSVQAAHEKYEKHKTGSTEALSWNQKMIENAADPFFEDSLKLVQEGNVQSASELMHKALMVDPRGTTYNLFTYWRQELSKNTTSDLREASNDSILPMLLAFEQVNSYFFNRDEQAAKRAFSEFLDRYQTTLRREKFLMPYAMMISLCQETSDDESLNYYLSQGNSIDPEFGSRLRDGNSQFENSQFEKWRGLWDKIQLRHRAALFYRIGRDFDNNASMIEEATQSLVNGNTTEAINQLKVCNSGISGDRVQEESFKENLQKAQNKLKGVISDLKKRPSDLESKSHLISELLGLKMEFLRLAKTAYEKAKDNNNRFSEINQALADTLFQLGSYRQAIEVMFQRKRPLPILSPDIDIEILDTDKTDHRTIATRIEEGNIYVTAYEELPVRVNVVRKSSIVNQYGEYLDEVEEGKTFDSITSSGKYWYIGDWSIPGLLPLLIPKVDTQVVLPSKAEGVDILRISGVNKEDIEAVAKRLNFVSNPRFVDRIPTGLSSKGESLAENLLNTRYPVAPSIARFLELIKSVEPLLLKSMVYGHIPPAEEDPPGRPIFEVAGIGDLNVDCTIKSRDAYLDKILLEMKNHYGEPPTMLKKWPDMR